MGRSNHASFRDESNLQLLKRKIRKSGLKVIVRKGPKSKKDEETGKDENSIRKRIWRRCLSLVRGPWSAQGVLDTEDPSKSVAMPSAAGTESEATSMDVIEIPIEPGQKISKILIKPTKTGIKAVIAQCRSPSPCPEGPREDEESPSEGTSWEGETLDRGDRSELLKERSLNWRTNIFKNEGEASGTKETLLTSALFIRQDMDNIVESAVFIEPSFPTDYADSRKSDELSQKSIKINKRRVSYRIIDERNEGIRKTIKTASEPTWVDRDKILERRHLQENINNLLEKFMILESEDVVSLTIPRSRPVQDGKTIHLDCNSSLHSTEDHFIKEISREVSPEILVNIKPFKEYLSDDHVGIRNSSLHDEDKRSQKVGGNVRSAKKSKGSRERNEKQPEEYLYPVLNGVVISQEHDYANVLKNYSGFKGMQTTISATETEISRTCYAECKEVGELASLERIEEEEEEVELSPGMCTIWGLCKTYSRCNRSWKKWGPEAGGSVNPPRKESLDELLDTLDDSDHELVFRKNISQFRKKLGAVPHLDLKKAGARVMGVRKKEQKKMKWRASFVDIPMPIIECVAEESEREEGEDQAGHRREGRKMGTLSVWNAAKWGDEVRSRRVLVTTWLLVLEGKVATKVLACKTEEVVVATMASSFREVHALVESGACVVVQREEAGRWEEVNEKQLVCVKASVAAEPVDQKKLEFVPKICQIEDDDGGSGLVTENEPPMPRRDIPQGFSFLSNATECFYLIQSPWHVSREQTSGCDAKHLKHLKLLEKTGIICLEKPEREADGGVGKAKFRLGSFMKCSEATFGPACRVVEILNDRAFEYVMSILGSECGSLSGCGREYSEGGLPSEWYSDSESDFGTAEGAGSRMDGFEILYNNERECLDDDEDEDEEDATKVESGKNVCGRKQSVVLAVEGLEEKKAEGERGEEKEGEREEEEEEKRVRGEKREVCSDEGEGASMSGEKKLCRFLKYKSISSPRENIIQNEFGFQEHRLRKSLVFSKEFEKDFQNCRKRRLSMDKGMDTRRTGSALLESFSPKLGPDRSFIQKKSGFAREKTFGTLVLSDELKSKLDPDRQALDKKKMILTNSSRPNVRKEVIAAFNSIRELSACKGVIKGGNKRMSLVIMLSKK